MLVRRLVHTFCGVMLLGVLAGSSIQAINAHRTTHFTFSGVVRLPGVSLAPGTYTFEVANPDSGGDVVRVLSRDRSRVFLMRFTRAVHRPMKGNLEAAITFGETAAGTAPPVKVWYPQGETRGREFIY